MKKIFNTVGIIICVLIFLGLAIKSCDSKKTCDTETGLQCQYESTCRPILIDLIFNK